MSFCPLIKKKCVESRCKFWTHLLGKNPQGDGVVDKFGCAIEFLPILLVENAQMVRQAAASTDKVANEVSGMNTNFTGAANVALMLKEKELNNKRLLDADKVKHLENVRTGE